ncbi:MAG: helix-turn-helix transcriptional regulator [Candidatus Heimdallarchaeaceae archaeon]
MVQRRNILLFGLLIFTTILLQNPNPQDRISGLNDPVDSTECLLSDSIIMKSHIIQVDIQSSDKVYVTEVCNIENQFNSSLSTLNLWLNHSCSNITIQDGAGEIDYDVLIQTTSYTQLSFDFDQALNTNESTVFYLSYNLNMMPLYEDVSDYYYFEYTSTINFYTLKHQLSIKLPKNSYIHEESGLTSIYPANYTQNVAGERLILSWTLNNQIPTINPIYIVRFNPPEIEQADLPVWAFIVGPIVGISIGVVSTYFLMRRKEGQSIKDMGVLFLNESQKILLGIIKEADGKIAQSDLGRKADFTRAKTSRNLLLLEEQGLVRKEKWGRNAIVYLTKAGEKVIE